MSNDLFVALDVEGTGLDPKVDRIIEISLVAATAAGLTGDSFTSHVNPEGRPIPAVVTQLTGIRDEDVADAPRFIDLLDRIEQFISTSMIVAYNAPYDLGMIEAEYDRAGRAMPAFWVECAMAAAKRHRPGGAMTLNAVAARYGIDTSHRVKHDALIDATLAAEIWNAIHRAPELYLEAGAAVGPAAISAPEIRAFGDGPTALLSLRSDLTLFGSALTPEMAARAASQHGYTNVALADRATTAGWPEFVDAVTPATRAIGGVAFIAAPFGGEVLAFAVSKDGLPALNRIATAAANGPLSPSRLRAAVADDRDQIALVASTAAREHSTAGGIEALRALVSSLEAAARVVALGFPRGEHDLGRRAEAEAMIATVADDECLPVVAIALARAANRKGTVAAKLMERLGGDVADADGHLAIPSPAGLEQMFADVPAALSNTRWLAAQLAEAPRSRKPSLPTWRELDGSMGRNFSMLVHDGLAERAAAGRLSPTIEIEAYQDRLDRELALIEDSGFDGYYRIVADMVAAARHMGIPVGPGRGSGAGSLVAYVLGITNLDPMPYGLLFERFINPERVSLPDFDIDFCEERRGEVIAYLRHRWGQSNVAGVATYGRMKSRQAVKDAARLAGLSYGQAETIAAALPEGGVVPTADQLEGELAELANNPDVAEILDDARSLAGLARNRSRHAAGIVISDRAIVDTVATFPDDNGEPITCLDKDGVEAAGLVKFDVLGVAALTIIERTRTILAAHKVEIDPWNLPLDDAAALAVFDQGQGVAVFQMEGAGMSAAARRMGIERFEDIIALVALYRPGPMAHIDTLAARKRGLEPARAPHPALESLLAETYGVMIYQEQVMEAARLLAGYSLGEADLLRRAMGKKIPAEMRAQQDRFVSGFVTNGHGTVDDAREMFELIDRFAGYGFNKSHAAAYALVAYVTAWLKAHHPAALLAATLDSKAGDADDVSSLAGEARRLGVPLLPPTVLRPAAQFTVEKVNDKLAIRWPLSAVRGIGRSTADLLAGGAPRLPTMAALASYVTARGAQLSAAAVANLAGAGALDGIYRTRTQAIAQAVADWKAATATAVSLAAGQGMLFGDVASAKPAAADEDDADLFSAERAALGVNLADHPADTFAASLIRMGAVPLTDAAAPRKEALAPRLAVGFIEAVKKARSGRGFSLVLSDASGRTELSVSTNAGGAELAEKGAVVAFWTSAGSDGRIRIGRLASPGQLAARLGQALRVRTGRGFDMQALRRALADAPKGDLAVEVMGEDGRLLTRTPPATFALDSNRIAAIARLPGVADVTTIQ